MTAVAKLPWSWPIGVIFFASLVGLVVGGLMTWDHQAYLLGGEGVCAEGGACEITRSAEVAINRIALPFGLPPLPIAILAVGCYFVVGWLAFQIWRKKKGAKLALSYLSAIAVGSVSLTLFLAGYSLNVQGAICLYCATLYGASVALLGGVFFFTRRPFKERLADLKGALSHRDALKFTAMFFGIVAFAYTFYALPLLVDREERLRKMWLDEATALPSKSVTQVNAQDRPTLGTKDAPVHIVEFADYGCSHCKQLYEALHRLLETRAGKVRVSILNYPLGNCAEARGTCYVPRAAECVFQQGAYDRFVSHAFDLGRAADQKDRVPKIVGELGLDLAKFQTCMEASATLERVKADRVEGNRLGVMSTPTFFINGRMVKGAAPLEALEAMVDGLVASGSK
jgi:protein-disulfide isomerase/uncharacterized membrane protein